MRDPELTAETTEKNWVVDGLLDLMSEMHEMGAELVQTQEGWPDWDCWYSDKKLLERLTEEMKIVDEALTKIRSLDH